MTTRREAKEAQFASLRAAYEDAFRKLTSQIRLLQSLTSRPDADSTAIEEARVRVEEARNEYREKRDLLARFLLEWTAKTPPTAPKSQVEFLARQLWESAGRPSGSADADWLRAEQLLLGKHQQAY